MGLNIRIGRRDLTIALLMTLALASVAAHPTERGAGPVVDPGLARIIDDVVGVIVRAQPGRTHAARAAVERAGGTITADLSIVDGFAADLHADAIAALAGEASIHSLTLDRPLHLADGGASSNPPSVYRAVTRADAVTAAGTDGNGVTVAVIDTGVAQLADFAGRLVTVVDPATGKNAKCANFSGEAGCADSYGHGTFVAGVLAGNGNLSGGTHRGTAAGANILSVKLSGRNGAADVSALLGAIQWIVSFKDTYGIRVINLSLGTDSPQPYLIDPLNFAVERAWDAGIVVVVAASNRGPGPATITKPADDPWVITVGAVDDRGTVGAGDDLVPNFSARGPTLSDSFAKPDLVAPGAHMVSLVAPNSAVAESFPPTIAGSYRMGSGTSFAAPVVAGIAAMMLQQNPALTPDQVKYRLMNTAVPTASADPFAVGRGMADAYAATFAGPAGSANQNLARSTGTGTLQASRGTLLVTAGTTGTLLNGLLTQQLRTFDAIAYTGASWHGASWHTSQWTGTSWHGASWHGASWHGASWHGASWHGASWHEADGSEPSYGTGLLGSAIYGAWE